MGEVVLLVLVACIGVEEVALAVLVAYIGVGEVALVVLVACVSAGRLEPQDTHSACRGTFIMQQSLQLHILLLQESEY